MELLCEQVMFPNTFDDSSKQAHVCSLHNVQLAFDYQSRRMCNVQVIVAKLFLVVTSIANLVLSPRNTYWYANSEINCHPSILVVAPQVCLCCKAFSLNCSKICSGNMVSIEVPMACEQLLVLLEVDRPCVAGGPEVVALAPGADVWIGLDDISACLRHPSNGLISTGREEGT